MGRGRWRLSGRRLRRCIRHHSRGQGDQSVRGRWYLGRRRRAYGTLGHEAGRGGGCATQKEREHRILEYRQHNDKPPDKKPRRLSLSLCCITPLYIWITKTCIGLALVV